MDARGIDPAVVKVEQGADGNGVVELLVGPAHGAQRGEVLGRNRRRSMIHPVDEAEQRFLGGRQRRVVQILEDGRYQPFVAEQFRRDRGVGLRSERAMVPP